MSCVTLEHFAHEHERTVAFGSFAVEFFGVTM